MKTFPINLQLNKFFIIIFGGGKVAEEKIKKLLPFNPKILIISPTITDYLSDLVEKQKICYIDDEYNSAYLDNCKIVIAATNNKKVNEAIYRYAKEKNILVNVVDDPDLCDFIMPAVISSDNFSIGISTNGKAAGYSRQIKDELQEYMDKESKVVEIIQTIRSFLKKKTSNADERKEKLMDILKSIQ